MKAPVNARRAICFASSIGTLRRSACRRSVPSPHPTGPCHPSHLLCQISVPRSGRDSTAFKGATVVSPLCPSARRSKALPVGGRAHAQASLKEAAKDFGAGEAASLGDGLKLILAVLNSAARCIEARPFDEDAGRCAGLALEVAHEVARAHMRAFRKRLH